MVIIKCKFARKCRSPSIGILRIVCCQCNCRKFVCSIHNRETYSFFITICTNNLCRIRDDIPLCFYSNVFRNRCAFRDCTAIFKRPTYKVVTRLAGRNRRQCACRRTIRYSLCFHCATAIHVKGYRVVIYSSRFREYLVIIKCKFARKCRRPSIGILCIICSQCDCRKFVGSICNRETYRFFIAIRTNNFRGIRNDIPLCLNRQIALYSCVFGNSRTIFKRPTYKVITRLSRCDLCQCACRRTIRYSLCVYCATAIYVKGYRVVIYSFLKDCRISYISSCDHDFTIPTYKRITMFGCSRFRGDFTRVSRKFTFCHFPFL